MEKYVRALDKDGGCLSYISWKFHGLSEVKFRVIIFDGSQIEPLKDNNSVRSMNYLQSLLWSHFVDVLKQSLEDHKGDNNCSLVETMWENVRKLGCNTSIKVHYLLNNFNKFLENSGS